VCIALVGGYGSVTVLSCARLTTCVQVGGGGITKLRVWEGDAPESLLPTRGAKVVGGSLHPR
jgi:hypothetical protein